VLIVDAVNRTFKCLNAGIYSYVINCFVFIIKFDELLQVIK